MKIASFSVFQGGSAAAGQVVAVTDNMEMTLDENEQDKRLFPDSYIDEDDTVEKGKTITRLRLE